MFFKRSKKRERRSIASNLCKFAKNTDIPIDIIRDQTHYEMNSNKEIIVEGCKGILQYEENIVKLNMQNMITIFCGRKLSIKCLTEDSLIITGFVTSVEFSV